MYLAFLGHTYDTYVCLEAQPLQVGLWHEPLQDLDIMHNAATLFQMWLAYGVCAIDAYGDQIIMQ